MANKFKGELEIKAGGSKYLFLGTFGKAAELNELGVNVYRVYERLHAEIGAISDLRQFMLGCLESVDGKEPDDKEKALDDLISDIGINEATRYAVIVLSYMIIGDPKKSKRARELVLQNLSLLENSTFLRLLRLPESWGLMMLSSGISVCLVFSLLKMLG